jgi:hypothetical protein
VPKWLRDQPKTFFVEEIRKLVDRWTKCRGVIPQREIMVTIGYEAGLDKEQIWTL